MALNYTVKTTLLVEEDQPPVPDYVLIRIDADEATKVISSIRPVRMREADARVIGILQGWRDLVLAGNSTIDEFRQFLEASFPDLVLDLQPSVA